LVPPYAGFRDGSPLKKNNSFNRLLDFIPPRAARCQAFD
jgi:hypothetical protein